MENEIKFTKKALVDTIYYATNASKQRLQSCDKETLYNWIVAHGLEDRIEQWEEFEKSEQILRNAMKQIKARR